MPAMPWAEHLRYQCHGAWAQEGHCSQQLRSETMPRAIRPRIPGTIGGAIQRLREQQKMGLRKLAKLSGVRESALHYLETNEDAAPNIKTLQKIAKALQCATWLIVQEWEFETAVMAMREAEGGPAVS
jgi:DNA-binding XRE family transcriptional regulator